MTNGNDMIFNAFFFILPAINLVFVLNIQLPGLRSMLTAHFACQHILDRPLALPSTVPQSEYPQCRKHIQCPTSDKNNNNNDQIPWKYASVFEKTQALNQLAILI